MATTQKTVPLAEDVRAYIESIEPVRRRDEAARLVEIYREATGLEPTLWTGNMIGFGQYHYKYKTGHEGDAMMTGFAPRKAKISLYLYLDEATREADLALLGKTTAGVACVYVNKLADIDEGVLRELIRKTMATVKTWYPEGIKD